MWETPFLSKSLRFTDRAFAILHTKDLNVELTLVSFSFFIPPPSSPFLQPGNNSNEPGAPAPIRFGHVGYFVGILCAIRDTRDKRYHGIPWNRVLHGTKEGRRWELGKPYEASQE